MKNITGMILLAGLAIGLFGWIAGADGIIFVKSARQKAHDELMKLVDGTTLKVIRAEDSRDTAVKELSKLSGVKQKIIASLNRVRRNIASAKEGIETKKIELKQIQEHILEEVPIKTISGRTLTSLEIAGRVKGIGSAIQLSTEKLGLLEDIENSVLGRLDKVDIKLRNAPTIIANLNISLDHLKDKVAYYKESYEMIMGEFDENSEFTSFVKDAQETLEKAHDHIDVKLAEVEQTFLTDYTEPIQTRDSVDSSEQIVIEINKLLGGPEASIQ